MTIGPGPPPASRAGTVVTVAPMRGPQGAAATAARHSRPSGLLQASARPRPAWSQPPKRKTSELPRAPAAKSDLGLQAAASVSSCQRKEGSGPGRTAPDQTSLRSRPPERRPPSTSSSSSSPAAPPRLRATSCRPALGSQGEAPKSFHDEAPSLRSAHHTSFMYSRARGPPGAPTATSSAAPASCRTPPMRRTPRPPEMAAAPKKARWPHGAAWLTMDHEPPKSWLRQTSPNRP
mmetsp:Transcript_49121/g.140955  ORF Transcript_49121/g.140955 Transcript_49121/m.140955 type:complete len:234 (-) Transcript_49121:352-1053(-)